MAPRKGVVAVVIATTFSVVGVARATTEPLTLARLLAQEDIGRIQIDPSGTHLVVEQLAAHAVLPRYDFQAENWRQGSQLLVMDLIDGGEFEPLVRVGVDAGYSAGPFSPTGRRMAVYRLMNATWRLGVIDMETRVVAWTTLSPALPGRGRALAWRSDDRLIILADEGDDGLGLSRIRKAKSRLAELWETAARGTIPALITNSTVELGTGGSNLGLYEVDTLSGAHARVAVKRPTDFELSPGGRHVAVLEAGAALPAPTGTPVRIGTPVRSHGVAIVDLDTGQLARPAAASSVSDRLLNWSPAGGSLLVYAPGPGLNGADGAFFSIEADGRTTPVAPARFRPEIVTDASGAPVPQGGWLGSDPLLFGRIPGSVRPDWWRVGRRGASNQSGGLPSPGRLRAQGRFRTAIDTAEGVAILNASQAAPEMLRGRALLPILDGGLRASSDPMGVSAITYRTADDAVCRHDLTTVAAPQCLASAETSDVSAIGWRVRAIVRRRIADDGVLSLDLEPTDGQPTHLLRLNSFLSRIDFPRAQRISAGSSSGWIYLPKVAGPACAAPVIIVPYPGTHFPTEPTTMRPGRARAFFNPNLLVEAGYAVIFPDLPSVGGEEEPATNLASRLVGVLDAAAASYPIDAGRAGLWGWSFGGWAAVEAATQTDRFGAVASLNGPMNLAGRLGVTPAPWRLAGDAGSNIIANAGWLESGQAGMLVPPWADPERYLRNSPVFAPDLINTPVMLMTTDQDPSLSDGEAMFAALYRLNKPAELIIFYGESHALASPANLQQMYSRTTAWFDRYLSPDNAARHSSPPRDAGYDVPNGPDATAIPPCLDLQGRQGAPPNPATNLRSGPG